MKLANDLVFIYHLLFPNFQNHCYLRIAYDNVILDKWNNKIKKPFCKNATEEQINKANNLLLEYKTNIPLLLLHNANSLLWRKQSILK